MEDKRATTDDRPTDFAWAMATLGALFTAAAVVSLIQSNFRIQLHWGLSHLLAFYRDMLDPVMEVLLFPVRTYLDVIGVEWTIPRWAVDAWTLSFVAAGLYVRGQREFFGRRLDLAAGLFRACAGMVLVGALLWNAFLWRDAAPPNDPLSDVLLFAGKVAIPAVAFTLLLMIFWPTPELETPLEQTQQAANAETRTRQIMGHGLDVLTAGVLGLSGLGIWLLLLLPVHAVREAGNEQWYRRFSHLGDFRDIAARAEFELQRGRGSSEGVAGPHLYRYLRWHRAFGVTVLRVVAAACVAVVVFYAANAVLPQLLGPT